MSDPEPVRRRDALLLAVLAAALLLPNLGGPALWSDEGDTAVFARTILARGLPFAWDGRTFTDSDRGERLTPDLLLVGTPWLPYYVAAGSFALLGPTALAARLPFALSGIGCVLLLHRLVARTAQDRRAALAAGILCLASVQFLIYSKECRHYALNMLLTLAVMHGFLLLSTRPRAPVFAAASVLLYHTHPLPAIAALGSLGTLAVLHPAFRGLRRAYLLWLPVVALFTLPWMLITWSGWQENSSALSALGELPVRLGQLGVELAETVPLVGWLLLALLARGRLVPGDGRFLWPAFAIGSASALLLALALSANELWALGLRYVPALLPLSAGVSGILAARAAAGSAARLTGLVALFGLTHLPGAAVLFAVAPERSELAPDAVIFHRPKGALGPWLKSEWLGYPRELTGSNPGSVADTVQFLREHAAADEILITNFDWDPVYFHTRLPQGLKILPGYPIREAARARGLPDYVFGVGGARWVVWRWTWEGYQGYHFDKLERALAERGARLERVATIAETKWENRPELHFRRFPGLGHLYPRDLALAGLGKSPPATIFRVTDGEAG